jgi:hypothetical protein
MDVLQQALALLRGAPNVPRDAYESVIHVQEGTREYGINWGQQPDEDCCSSEDGEEFLSADEVGASV